MQVPPRARGTRGRGRGSRRRCCAPPAGAHARAARRRRCPRRPRAPAPRRRRAPSARGWRSCAKRAAHAPGRSPRARARRRAACRRRPARARSASPAGSGRTGCGSDKGASFLERAARGPHAGSLAATCLYRYGVRGAPGGAARRGHTAVSPGRRNPVECAAPNLAARPAAGTGGWCRGVLDGRAAPTRLRTEKAPRGAFCFLGGPWGPFLFAQGLWAAAQGDANGERGCCASA